MGTHSAYGEVGIRRAAAAFFDIVNNQSSIFLSSSRSTSNRSYL